MNRILDINGSQISLRLGRLVPPRSPRIGDFEKICGSKSPIYGGFRGRSRIRAGGLMICECDRFVEGPTVPCPDDRSIDRNGCLNWYK